MSTTRRIALLFCAVVAITTSSADAANYTWRLSTTPADWTSANWGDGTNYPVTGDTATIGRRYYGNPATVDVTGTEAASVVNMGTNDAASIGTLNIKSGGSLALLYFLAGSPGTATINIEAGGEVTFTGSYHTTYIGQGGGTGTLDIEGSYSVGMLRIGDTGIGRMYLHGNGSYTCDPTRTLYIGYDVGGDGLVEVSDSATLDGVNLFIGNNASADATFRVVGGNATLSLSNVLDMDQGSGRYEVHLDETGISTLAVTGQARFGATGGIIAPTALAGAQADTYTVMTYASYSGTPVLEDPTGKWEMNVGATSLTLTYVPEPTALALLAVGSLAALRRRRRK